MGAWRRLAEVKRLVPTATVAVALPAFVPYATEEDQFAPDLSKLSSRLSDLPSGKHIVDIWIYRQPQGSRNPEPLAAGELVVRK